MKQKRKKKAFSLFEIIIFISLLALFAASFAMLSQKSTEESSRKAIHSQCKNVLHYSRFLAFTKKIDTVCLFETIGEDLQVTASIVDIDGKRKKKFCNVILPKTKIIENEKQIPVIVIHFFPTGKIWPLKNISLLCEEKVININLEDFFHYYEMR